MQGQLSDWQGVSHTALWTLRARAEEHQRRDGLFADPHALSWHSALPWTEDLERWYSKHAQRHISVRTRHFDELLQRHLDAAAEEAEAADTLVVELGCGLSSRYHRVGAGRCRWVLLDLPELVASRRRLDPETDAMRYLARSVLDLGWIDEVRSLAAARHVFVAEGLLMYFEAHEVRSLLDALARAFPDAVLLFDVAGRRAQKMVNAHTEKLQAPFRWALTDERELAGLPLQVLSVASMFEVYPGRQGLARLLGYLPSFRAMNLFIEARLRPA